MYRIQRKPPIVCVYICGWPRRVREMWARCATYHTDPPEPCKQLLLLLVILEAGLAGDDVDQIILASARSRDDLLRGLVPGNSFL